MCIQEAVASSRSRWHMREFLIALNRILSSKATSLVALAIKVSYLT